MDSGINASDSQGAVFVLCPYDYMNGYVSIFLIRISAICLKQAKLYQSLPTTKKNLIANCNATSYAACVRDYVKLNKDVCDTETQKTAIPIEQLGSHACLLPNRLGCLEPVTQGACECKWTRVSLMLEIMRAS